MNLIDFIDRGFEYVKEPCAWTNSNDYYWNTSNRICVWREKEGWCIRSDEERIVSKLTDEDLSKEITIRLCINGRNK